MNREYFDSMAATWDQDPMKQERARLTAQCCLELNFETDDTLLDVGGGTGLLSMYLHRNFSQITIADTSSEMLAQAQQKIEASHISNIDTLLIEKGISEISSKFSAIISLMTLHHLKNINEFLYTAYRLLNDDGLLMIADLYKEDGTFHRSNKEFDGHNGFDIEQFERQLRSNGFTVESVKEYFQIEKEIAPGSIRTFPLFFLVAQKR